MKYKTLLQSCAVITCFSGAIFLSSCEEKGPAERAGEKLDEAAKDLEDAKDAEDVGEALDKLAEEDKGILEKTGEKLQEVGDDIKDAAEGNE